MHACLPRCHRFILGLLFLATAAFSMHSSAQDTRQTSASESAAPAASSRRVALVVGNTAYASKPLPNAVNDAVAISKRLTELGFEVELLKDVARAPLNRAITRFGDRARGAQTALFFFAGHGSMEENRSFIWPLGAKIEDEADMDDELLSVAKVLEKIEKRAQSSIVILDACRDAPITGKAQRSMRGGLGEVKDKADGTALIYAAAPGQTASDGSGSNGVFTAALLTALQGQDLRFNVVMEQAAKEVNKTYPRQRPHVNADELLRSTFNFSGQVTITPSAAATEAQFWDTVKDSNDVAELEEYKRQYPKGQFAGLADIRIRRLKAAALQPAPRPVAVQVAPVAPAATPVQAAPTPPPPAPVAPAPAAPQAGSTFKDCADCPDMVVIPAGSFTMGSPAGEAGSFDDEGPQHAVRVPGFSMGKTEVTVAQFRRFAAAKNYQTDAERNLNATGCYAWLSSDSKFDWRADHSWRNPGWAVKDNEPVTCISHNDATAYVQWLSQTTRKPYQLPSEAQWEYAARAGSSTGRPWGDNPNEACKHANGADQTKGPGGQSWSKIHECNDGYWFVAPVANYQANAFGLHDMLGNVSEWTQDCWNETYQGAPTDGSAWTTGDCSQRVLRGGSWDSYPAILRSANRDRGTTGGRITGTGFRLARTLP